MKKIPRLGVNIDHVATIRQARGESYPSLVKAAIQSIQAGADQITIHLREDRRHIQDQDVYQIKEVTKRYCVPLNLEMGCDLSILAIALEVKPEWVCLVPEKREERTTEGGLNLLDQDCFLKMKHVVNQLRENSPYTKISLFIEAKEQLVEKVNQLGVDAVEIHTGDYARAHAHDGEALNHLQQFMNLKSKYQTLGIGYHAGHGLTDKNCLPLLEKKIFTEYNIGHWIIAESIFTGLNCVVSELSQKFKNYPLD